MNEIRLITEDLLDELVDAMATATSICLIVSFAAGSGVSLIAAPLHQALLRGAEIKILVGDYLYITEPEALEGLLQLGSDAEVRLWQSRGRSFHPKAYLLQSEDDEGTLFVGSSNLSRSALIHGVEWNLAVEARIAPLTFAMARQKFMESFYDPCTLPITFETIARYRELYQIFHLKHPQTADMWRELESTNHLHHSPVQELPTRVAESPAVYGTILPRPAQSEALTELMRTREEGYDKAMVVMATGLGKTYLSAFLARHFTRVLFVAHREEILNQASRSFQEVMPERSVGLYNGHTKSMTTDTVLASIFTLAMKRHREAFQPEDFDLIIIDEFHHAAARSYRKLLEYFHPLFLLGITATPERADGQDIFGLCDGNVAYQIRFIEAIERGWLAPFHYYGVYDDIDYKAISWLGSQYDEEELYIAQIQFEMGDRVLEAWRRHRGTRTLAFCSSIRQSEYLAHKFVDQGIRATSLHSRSVGLSRQEAIDRLSEGTLDVLFTVDLFNEGVDIPAVDTLLFVRPTESLTVFIQQIGRGLRLHPGKGHCTIIDLIGNYHNADSKLRVFDTRVKKDELRQPPFIQNALPSGCLMELDPRVVHLLQEMARKRLPRRESLRSAYITLKMELGRRPTYLDFHLHGFADSQAIRQEFHSYTGFLSWLDELTKTELDIYTQYSDWLQEVEKTTMTRSYKMVLLSYLLSRGDGAWIEPITPNETAHYFHSYLSAKEYRKKIDLTDDLWVYNEARTASLIARMPMAKWAGSSKGWAEFADGQFRILLHDEPSVLKVLREWTQQICDYRLHTYFERKQRQEEKE